MRLVAALALVALLVALPLGGRAQVVHAPTFWFAGTRLIFDRAIPLDGDVAVASRDSGLARLLQRVGASLSYAPQQRYLIITSADRRTITFTIGTAQYTAGGVTAKATFAPFVDGGDVIVPLYAVARALYLEPIADGGETVLQPQIGAIDVRADGGRTLVEIRGATQLAYVKRVDLPQHVELAFAGVGSALGKVPRTGALDGVTVTSGGSVRNPTTIVAIDAPAGTAHVFLAPPSPYELSLAFTRGGGAAVAVAPPPVLPTAPPVAVAPPPAPLPPVAAAPTPTPAAAPSNALPAPTAPAGSAAVITGIVLQPQDDGLQIRVTVNGSAAYEWHRLADQRWYVDIRNATLTDAGRDERPPGAAVESVRIRQIGTADWPTVRIAMTLRGEKQIDLTPTPDGLQIVASNGVAVGAIRTGSGRIGPSVALDFGTPPPQPPEAGAPQPGATGFWKFTPSSRIIVIDPGHGGGDHGTEHSGVVEKNVTLDIARRLRSILTAQGWIVRMTRDSDIDPVSDENLAAMRADGRPNPDDRAYLQTRDDVANKVNARMFISIHVNYAPDPAVNGTTFYWYKPEDLALAQAMERAVIGIANTNDMGARHDNLYVVRHATMPAVLIETAFVSNPGDVALLRSGTFLQNVAQGIANGVKAFAGSAPPQSSRVDQ